MSDTPNVVDWLTLAVAGLGASLSAITSIWIARQNFAEKFHLHIDWTWDQSGPIAEYPVLYVQNRSSTAIQVAEIAWYRGLIFRRKSSQTAKWYDDPSDLNFPYEVATGATGSYALEEDGAEKQFAKVSAFSKRLGWIRRGTIWIGVATVAGTRKFISADSALPWKLRPSWLKISND